MQRLPYDTNKALTAAAYCALHWEGLTLSVGLELAPFLSYRCPLKLLPVSTKSALRRVPSVESKRHGETCREVDLKVV